MNSPNRTPTRDNPAFRCIGGSLLYRQIGLSRDDMLHFRDLYRIECDCAFKAGINATEDYERAAWLLKEVVDALALHDQWSRAQGGKVQ